MKNRRTFLTAHWGNLLLLNYKVPSEVLEPHLPRGCELDLFQGDAFLSLVAFQFTRTRVFGLRWPLYTDFPEINLRFYLKHQGRRGVSFLREFVPSRLVSGIARLLYNEPYSAAQIRDEVRRENGLVHARYELSSGPHALDFRVTALDQPHLPKDDSVEHFFKEHELGVGRDREGNTLTYEVEHPFWRVFPVQDFSVRLDAAGLYGPSFAFLRDAKPASVVLAEGSEIVVYGKAPA
ncbi:MAG: YqjF family protein [Bdellovibrionota bacterium]